MSELTERLDREDWQHVDPAEFLLDCLTDLSRKFDKMEAALIRHGIVLDLPKPEHILSEAEQAYRDQVLARTEAGINRLLAGD